MFAAAATGRVAAQQPAAPTNLDFEAGAPGELPTGWLMATTQAQPGISARIVTDERRSGAQSVVLTREPSAAAGASLNLLQLVDATAYRGRRVRFRMAVRTEAAASPAQMWMRVDGAAPAGFTAPNLFLDNMDDRPITGQDWRHYEIAAECHRRRRGSPLASTWSALAGRGSMTAFESSRSPTRRSGIAPRDLTTRALNLLAFSRLLGYVRHFHPSDEAARTDWDGFPLPASARWSRVSTARS